MKYEVFIHFRAKLVITGLNLDWYTIKKVIPNAYLYCWKYTSCLALSATSLMLYQELGDKKYKSVLCSATQYDMMSS